MASKNSACIRAGVKQLLELLAITPIDHTVGIWGPPGIGKTDVVRQFAASQGAELVTLRVSEMEPQDLLGLPDLQNDFTVYKPLRYLFDLTKTAEARRRETMAQASVEGGLFGDAAFEPTNAVLFLDELTNAPPSMMTAIQYLILNRTVGVGGLELADGVRIIAAGNREQDGAFASELSTPVKSRMKHIEYSPSFLEWQSWARANEVHTTVLAFLARRERLFLDFDPRSQHHTFPCPRTWTLLSGSLKLLDARGGADAEIRRLNAEAYVGPGAAVEFTRFEDMVLQCPPAAEIIESPMDAPVFARRPDISMVCLENLAAACRREPDRFVDGSLLYVSRLHREYQTIFHGMVLNIHGDAPEDLPRRVLESPNYGLLKASLNAIDRVVA